MKIKENWTKIQINRKSQNDNTGSDMFLFFYFTLCFSVVFRVGLICIFLFCFHFIWFFFLWFCFERLNFVFTSFPSVLLKRNGGTAGRRGSDSQFLSENIVYIFFLSFFYFSFFVGGLKHKRERDRQRAKR